MNSIYEKRPEMINVSGSMVWPRDVEDLIYQYPGVKEAAERRTRPISERR
jgi:long-chain acyl-CoA synthetase